MLSQLSLFESPEVKLEQYPTDSEIAADILWKAQQLGDITGKVIADLGCGTGIIGIGAGLLGAKKVFFVDSDKNALLITQKNINTIPNTSFLKDTNTKSESTHPFLYKIINQTVSDCVSLADTVIQNPPFGTKVRHLDREFLKKAAEIARVTYSLHKTTTIEYITKYAQKSRMSLTHRWDYLFPLKNTYEFHQRRIKTIEVSCLRFEMTTGTKSESTLN